MPLSVRRKPYVLPSYSLTGDLLAFGRCPLAYRFNNVGKLPPSRPIQLWFGEFIHGVMEESWRILRDDPSSLPPWPYDQIKEICDRVEGRLRAKGLYAWSRRSSHLARMRAVVAVNELGPSLLPLIERAEVRVAGARMLPDSVLASGYREADRYEMAGVIDVVTEVTLNDPAYAANPIVSAIAAALPVERPSRFEVILDYKGARRPPFGGNPTHNYSAVYDWQLQTYAHLRSRQEGSRPVLAAGLLFLNELLPARADLTRLVEEIDNGTADVAPSPGSAIDTALRTRLPGRRHPKIPFEFRLARTLRINAVTNTTVSSALGAFDEVVADIEECHRREAAGETITSAWRANPSDHQTCAACDHRTRCTAYQATGTNVDRLPREPWGRGTGAPPPVAAPRRLTIRVKTS